LTRPLIVIGSSRENEGLAEALQENLGDKLDVLLWTQMFTGTLSRQVLEVFEGELDVADFAAFIFAPDDDLSIRGEKTKTVRDNVILELGVARGLLGRERAFIVRPTDASADLREISDLGGVIAATYDGKEAQGERAKQKRALLSAANEIRATAQPLSFRPRPPTAPPRRVDGVLDRGSTERLPDLADAAIYIADKQQNYFKELRNFLTGVDVVPSKYLYWTPQGSAHWLEFCKLKRYQFYENSMQVLKAHVGTLVREIVKATGTAEIDFVSVGSGNGEKDHILLRHLGTSLGPEQFIYYYPVDISGMLIFEAVRTALGRGLSRKKFKVKALIADFVKLEKLQAFYEERSSPNVFSVLGNTVGNADEDELMKAVADAMLEGDLVLMEVNASEPDISDPIWSDRVTVGHDFTPLTVFNVPLRADLMEYSVIEGISTVQGTKSILASYREALIEGKQSEDIKLSIVHYYKHQQFLEHMKDKLNVRILWSSPKPEHGVYLALGIRDGIAEDKEAA
jgi:uncharacterized SAM-dependent methyltransferase